MESTPQDPPPPDQAYEQKSQQMTLLVMLGVLIFVILFIAFIYFFGLRGRSAPAQETQPQKTTQPLAAAPLPSLTNTLTLTPTVSPTLRATFTPEPTRTSTVTLTATITPTPPLAPSLTPAVPVEDDTRYELVGWTPELADQLISELEAYPDTLSAYARGEDNSGYYAAFSYAVLALREALLQFPSAPQAADWQWKLAYNLARSGESPSIPLFTSLITQELNAGTVRLDNLYEWGLTQNPPAAIETYPLDTPTGFLSSSLVKVSLGENGSGFFWLLEQPSGFDSYPLTNDFDFVHPTQVDYFVEDLIGEGSAVAGIFRRFVPNTNRYQLPRLFSLAQRPPGELGFEPFTPPEIGPEFENNWVPLASGSPEGDLQFQSTVFPACPVLVKHNYAWNGSAFEFRSAEYQIQPDLELLGFCEQVINHSASIWGLETTVQLMETLLPDWPPKTTSTGDPYPNDALDEWRYRLAIYQALLGNQEEATGYANAIVNNPSSPASQWIEPAQDFLNTYQDQTDIFKVCLSASFCDPHQAFESLISTISPQDYPDLRTILSEAGVTYLSSGFFDFDNDGQTETWFVLRPKTGSDLEFWIVFQEEDRLVPLFVDYVDAAPQRITYQEPLQEPPIVSVDPDINFQITRQGKNQVPSIVFVPEEVVFSADQMKLDLDKAENELLNGGEVEAVRTNLVELRKSPIFTCSYQLCPRYLYLLGLANELVLKEDLSIQAYLELWRNFLGNPYVTMARYKLSGPAIPPGPTITPTRTITPRPTATRSFFRTATPTRTPTVTGTPPTATPTITGTIFTPTITLTPTVTQGYPAP
jgi:hypothetical protein